MADELHSLSYLLDIGNSTIFNSPVRFTEKYHSIEHYQRVLDDRLRFEQLLCKMIAQENSEEINLAELVEGSGFEEAARPALMQLLKLKYSEYKKEFVRRELCQGGRCLVGFNWRIKVNWDIFRMLWAAVSSRTRTE
jgi:hypothetical protein